MSAVDSDSPTSWALAPLAGVHSAQQAPRVSNFANEVGPDSLPAMSADDLAAELLSTVLDADPLAGSLYGFPGYDDRLPDLSADAEDQMAAELESIARRAEDHPDKGLAETEHQTLDFVRVLARGMADAARVPLTEFTICDTFVAPVPGVLTTLPKLPLDTEERRQGYLDPPRAACPALLATAGERHRQGARAGRTAVARLVESAVTQLDLLIGDPDLGGVGRAERGRRVPAARHRGDRQRRPPRAGRLPRRR